MIGRGFRLSPETGKTECLILDYGRNIERFGPIDLIGKNEERGMGKGERRGPLAKTCPKCRNLVALPVMLCPECGFEFPRQDAERRMHEAEAARTAILSGEVTVETHNVSHVEYQVWEKRGAPPDAPKTVRVTYYFDMLHSVSEWLCPEHRGYARSKFERWWKEHGHAEAFIPNTAEDVCELHFMGMIREVESVTVRRVAGEKYPEVVGYDLGEYPLDSRGTGNGEQAMSEEAWEDYDDLPF
jgi:DNA repair protein RadD